jgi:hypothetical protein
MKVTDPAILNSFLSVVAGCRPLKVEVTVSTTVKGEYYLVFESKLLPEYWEIYWKSFQDFVEHQVFRSGHTCKKITIVNPSKIKVFIGTLFDFLTVDKTVK